jgi:hypothetical protein
MHTIKESSALGNVFRRINKSSSKEKLSKRKNHKWWNIKSIPKERRNQELPMSKIEGVLIESYPSRGENHLKTTGRR